VNKRLNDYQCRSVLGGLILGNCQHKVVQLVSWFVFHRCGVRRQWSMVKVKVIRVHVNGTTEVKDEC
jgi:hypothetical protein